MLLDSAVTEYALGRGVFDGFGIQCLSKSYTWKLPSSTSRYVRVPSGVTNYEANVILKKALHKIWKDEVGRRREITQWVISDWGGVRANSPERLDYYSREAQSDNPDTPLGGIASFSKVLAIADPDKFAIMDARIVVSLTAIQVLADVSDGIVFPYLTGRNLITGHTARKVGFSQNPELSQRRLVGRYPSWSLATKNDAYSVYFTLLKSICAKQELKCPILDLEMALFADSERLATLCQSALKSAESEPKK